MSKDAKLFLGDRSIIACCVCDLSNHGACLHVAGTAKLPPAFELSFDTGLTLRKCRVAWRAPPNVGVYFEQPVAA